MSIVSDEVRCVDCGGTGIDDWDESMGCPLCDGTGKLVKKDADAVTREWTEYGRVRRP